MSGRWRFAIFWHAACFSYRQQRLLTIPSRQSLLQSGLLFFCSFHAPAPRLQFAEPQSTENHHHPDRGRDSVGEFCFRSGLKPCERNRRPARGGFRYADDCDHIPPRVALPRPAGRLRRRRMRFAPPVDCDFDDQLGNILRACTHLSAHTRHASVRGHGGSFVPEA